MSDDLDKWERKCARIRKENDKILDKFGVWLYKKKLSDKTIRKHVGNIDFYINNFLLYDDAVKAKDGAFEVGMFLGYWFIRKVAWATPGQIKGNAASLKKFYTFMREQGLVKKEDLDELKEIIKTEMPE